MSKYELITDLCESKVFRSRQAANKMGDTDRHNLLYATLLSVIAGSLDTTTNAWAKDYASRTAAFGNFDFFRPSATDLYVSLHLTKFSQAETGRLIRVLRGIARGNTIQSELQQVLLRLERSLRGLNPRLKTARRGILAWESTSPASRKAAVQNLILTLNQISRRSEALPYMKTLKSGPRGHFGKTSTLKKAAAIAGLGLAGLAIGAKRYDPSRKFRLSRMKDSIELGVANMLVEDRATQLAYIVQKLPEHPAVEKIISVNYIADGISAFVRAVDGNAYEFEIRPAKYARGHEEKRELDQRNKERLEKLKARITEKEELQTQTCMACDGSGIEWGETCVTCAGKGITMLDGSYVEDDDLWEYRITEVEDEPKCQNCYDTGWMTEKHWEDTVKVPCHYCDAERTTDRFE